MMTTMIRPRNAVRPAAAGFALVLTLFILSVLAIVAVSYLASMSAERATANAFANKARAEAAARAGADAAMAILRENLRAFPDSVTAWDAAQAQSLVKQPDGTTKTILSAGTSLYLRAKPGAGSPVVPDPAADNRPPNTTPAADNRRNFVLPLVSGVPKGQARLVSEKGNIFPVFPASDSDPKDKDYEKTSTDLNVRRSANDKQGVIGSPPDWTDAAPKPARAPWVELKDEAGLTLARYAFIVEDDSFKAPLNLPGNLLERADNGPVQIKDSGGRPRAFDPTDLSVVGPLASLGDTTSASNLISARSSFPGSRFLEPRGAAQTTGLTQTVADALRYVVSTDSGALNLSRHGSQRLNLNAATTVNRTSPVSMTEIRRLVETMRFHLPDLGQRFYRNTNPDQSPPLSAAARATLLNRTSDVSGIHPDVYLYKLAANLRDYLDQDLQPTVLVQSLPNPPPNGPPVLGPTSVEYALGGDGKGGNGFYVWAQGKESAPFLQEAVVRYRPVVNGTNNTYTLKVDYYLEFWNMSNRDVSARDLGRPFVRVINQQGWFSGSLKPNPSNNDEPAINAPLETTDSDGLPPKDDKATAARRDFNIDLLKGVYSGLGPSPGTPADPSVPTMPNGVIFKAGQATVITTDPDYATLKDSYYHYGGQKLWPFPPSKPFNTDNFYYCAGSPEIPPGKREFKGSVPPPANAGWTRGILPNFRMGKSSAGTAQEYEIEIALGNERGYLDWAIGPVAISCGRFPERYDFTSASSGTNFNDYIHGGTIFGNSTTTSQLGDPRTANEQLVVNLFTTGSMPSQPDQTRYATAGANDNPPFALGAPNSVYTKPARDFNPWPDYWDWASTAYPTTNATALTSPAVIADGPLTSIGQLGDLFDPARLPGVNNQNQSVGGAGIGGSRGGGRTLKIGQRDDRYSADPTSDPNTSPPPDAIPASNGWAAWRLTDIFGLDDAVRLPARVNLNGVPRDNGAALRSALTGFKFQPQTGGDPLIHGDRLLAGKDLNADPAAAGGLKELIEALKIRLNPAAATPATALTLPRPLFERGELGELGSGVETLFGINSTSGSVANVKLVPGVDMNKAYDRGREEVFRRLAEVTCTRGDTFTVHCVGQAIIQPTAAAPKRVTSTQRLRLTFRLMPKQADGSPFQPGATTNADGSLTPTGFNPADPADIARRFARPDHYDVQIIQAASILQTASSPL